MLVKFRYFYPCGCMFVQEFLSNSSTSHTIENVASISVERMPNDERSAGKSRGWLNWLSRGMLGAGGTDDSGQFSGVVSDEVIKVFLIQLGSSKLGCC